MGRISYVTIRGSKLSFGYPQNELCKNLNADMVDGFHASSIALPNVIPVTNEDGKIDSEFLPTGIGGDIKVVIDKLDYNKYVKVGSAISITPQAHTDQANASIDYYKWTLPDNSIVTTTSSNPTLVYEDTNEEKDLTFKVIAVDTYGNQSVSNKITISVVQELPPVINSISWDTSDFYENKSYIMMVFAESYENKPLNYQVTCNDTDVVIDNYQDQQDKFIITFPELTEEKVYDFSITVSDGNLQTQEIERCVVKPMFDFIYRFEDTIARSNIVADSDGYLYIAIAKNTSPLCITIEKMDKGLVTKSSASYQIDLDVDLSEYKGTLCATIYDNKLYILIPARPYYYMIEVNTSDLSLLRTSLGSNIETNSIAIPVSLLTIGNKWYIGCNVDERNVVKRRLFRIDLDQLLCDRLHWSDQSISYYMKTCISNIIYDPSHPRIITNESHSYETGLNGSFIISYDLNLERQAPSFGKTYSTTIYRYNDQSSCIIGDYLYSITFYKDVLQLTKIRLNEFPDINSIERSIKWTNIGIDGFTSYKIRTVKMQPINSTEMLVLLNLTKNTRGGFGIFFLKIDTDFNLLGSAKVDSIKDDYSVNSNSEFLILDNYIYIPFKTSISYGNTTAILKLNLDNITNNQQSFCLDSFPVYLDTGIIPSPTVTDTSFFEAGSKYVPTTSDINYSDTELQVIPTTVEIEKYRDVFI